MVILGSKIHLQTVWSFSESPVVTGKSYPPAKVTTNTAGYKSMVTFMKSGEFKLISL